MHKYIHIIIIHKIAFPIPNIGNIMNYKNMSGDNYI